MKKQKTRGLHDCCKVKDIARGKQNYKKKVIKAKPDSLSMLNWIKGQGHGHNHDVALSTNNLYLLERQ